VGGPIVSAAGIMVILSVALTFPVQMFPAAELWEIRAGLEVPIAPPLSTSTVASNNDNGDDDRDNDDTSANTTYSPVMTYRNNKKKEDDDDDYAEDDEGQEEGLLEVDESINDLEDCLQHVNDDNDDNNQEKKMKKKKKHHHIRSQKRLEYLENKSENNLDDYRRLMLRLCLVAGCGVFAFIVKDLEQLVSVIGSVICIYMCVCVFFCFVFFLFLFFFYQMNIRRSSVHGCNLSHMYVKI
jgi:hypothetical protein